MELTDRWDNYINARSSSRRRDQGQDKPVLSGGAQNTVFFL